MFEVFEMSVGVIRLIGKMNRERLEGINYEKRKNIEKRRVFQMQDLTCILEHKAHPQSKYLRVSSERQTPRYTLSSSRNKTS